MVYIKVLVVLLCSCVIQDALSAVDRDGDATTLKRQNSLPQSKATVQKQKTVPPQPKAVAAAAPKPKPGAAAAPKLKAAAAAAVAAAPKPKPAAAAAPKLKAAAAAAVAAAPKPKAATSKQKPVVPQPAPKPVITAVPRKFMARPMVALPPPPKYPALAQLWDNLWDTAERVNAANEYGKRDVRAKRNLIATVLSSPSFWAAATGLLSKMANMTNDERKAETRVRVCNEITRAMTQPTAVQDFGDKIDLAYDVISSLDPMPFADALYDASVVVQDGTAVRALEELIDVIQDLQIDPAIVTRAFSRFKSLMNKSSMPMAGVMKNDRVASGINRLGSAMNRKK